MKQCKHCINLGILDFQSLQLLLMLVTVNAPATDFSDTFDDVWNFQEELNFTRLYIL